MAYKEQIRILPLPLVGDQRSRLIRVNVSVPDSIRTSVLIPSCSAILTRRASWCATCAAA